jgi:hypothetical protein
MAVGIGASPDEVVIRIEFLDVNGERLVKTFPLDGAETDANAIAIMDAIDGLSNALITKASILSGRPFTGLKSAAVDAVERKVSDIMALTFTKTDPVNASKTVKRGFIIPAYLGALIDTDYHPVSTNSDLNALVVRLAADLNYLGNDGTFYPGSWTYQNGFSGFGSTTREIDGLPG